MNDFTLRRAYNDGWILSVGANDGSLHPFHAFSSTDDLLRALPKLLEKPDPSKPNQFQPEFQPGGSIGRKFSADASGGKN
jgi:hypothetical protein